MKLSGVSAFSSGIGRVAGASAGAGSAAGKAGISAAAARVGSGAFNFEINRHWSFQSIFFFFFFFVRYLILFGSNMLCNACMVTAFSYIGMPAALGKLAADTVLFIANYHIQKRWVFHAPRKR